MIFPEKIKEGSVIAVTAPSDGVSDELDIKRFRNGARKLKETGNDVFFTGHVFYSLPNGSSAIGEIRARELNELFARPNVSAIYSAKGGKFLYEMLPYVDYIALKRNPKWIQGYSDNTGLLYTITTKYDVATAYGANFGDYGMEVWDDSVKQNYDLLRGRTRVQHGFLKHQSGFFDKVTGLEGYQLDEETRWVNARGESRIEMSGRLIGGCLDVLLNLAGTKYDATKTFINKYAGDGIIWFLESFSTNSDDLPMQLWHLKELGWFKGTKGFIFGRPMFYNSFEDISYEESVLYELERLNVPIIFNADIGHKGPQMTMINGAKARILSENGNGSVTYSEPWFV